MIKKIHFFLEYLKNPKQVGAVAESSKFLIKNIVTEIDTRRANCVVEFGAGQGSITKALLKKMRQNQKLLVFEINKKFLKELRQIKDKRLIIIEDAAQTLPIYLEKYGIKKVDYIVSSLPITWLSKKEMDVLLREIKNSLNTKGKYIQYTTYLRHYQIFAKYFKNKNIKLKYTLLNIPPTFIYVCEKEK